MCISTLELNIEDFNIDKNTTQGATFIDIEFIYIFLFIIAFFAVHILYQIKPNKGINIDWYFKINYRLIKVD